MKMTRVGLLIVSACLAAACTTTRTPAPIVDLMSGEQTAETAVPAGFHKVEKGETLNAISRKYGQELDDLIAWNNLADPNAVSVGQVLRVQAEGRQAVDGAQVEMGSVTTSGVVIQSLDGSGQPAPLADAATKEAPFHKITPIGAKEPYSNATMTAMATDVSPTEVTSISAANEIQPSLMADTRLAARNVEGVSWIWPADGAILSTFHDKKKGIDIGGKAGDPVSAAAAGKVIYAGTMNGYGKLVIIKHSNDLLSAYAHNQQILVNQKQKVAQGQQIAKMGNTGSAVVQSHFEIRRHGKPIDPARFLPIAR